MTEQEQKDLKNEIHNVFKNRYNLEVKMFITIEAFINKRYKAINYTRCCEEVCDCEFERIDSRRIQCVKCEMIQIKD